MKQFTDMRATFYQASELLGVCADLLPNSKADIKERLSASSATFNTISIELSHYGVKELVTHKLKAIDSLPTWDDLKGLGATGQAVFKIIRHVKLLLA